MDNIAGPSRRDCRPNISTEEIHELILTTESDEDVSDIDIFSNYSPSNDSNSDEYDSDNETIPTRFVTNQASTSTPRPMPTKAKKRRVRDNVQVPLYHWEDCNDDSDNDTVHDPVRQRFDSSTCGISKHFDADSTELDFFKSFVTQDFVSVIVDETNKFYRFVTAQMPLAPHSRLQKWNDTSADEMYTFIAMCMLMVRHKKLALHEYWSTDPLLHSTVFGNIMSRDRFFNLTRMLHFCDNNEQADGDRLFKIRRIVDMLRLSFKNTFSPFQNICIDESLMLFKGRLAFKQYIPSKRHRFGVKLFVLCDVETGYVVDFIVYTGADTDIVDSQSLGVSGAVVTTLLQPYLGKGHTLWIDNWYTSPDLAKYLLTEKTDMCGTVRKNRRGMPVFTEKLNKGDVEAKHTQEMLALKWRDKRDVCMLSTFHKNEVKDTGKIDRNTQAPIKKPACVLDYNINMGAVDRSDMMLSSIECLRKTLKWYKKLFFHLIDISLINAHGLYRTHSGKNISLADFQLTVTRQIIEQHLPPKVHPKGGRRSANETPLRLTQRHFPELVPPTEKRKNAMRSCRVCGHTNLGPKKRKESRYMCGPCDVGLCVVPCFGIYHTLKTY